MPQCIDCRAPVGVASSDPPAEALLGNVTIEGLAPGFLALLPAPRRAILMGGCRVEIPCISASRMQPDEPPFRLADRERPRSPIFEEVSE